MEPGESSYSAERRRFPIAFLAGAIVVALMFGGFYLLTRILGSRDSAAAVRLPFGPAEQAYAERIHFNDLHMSRSTNMIRQEFTYVTGIMSNDGDRTIRAMEVTVEFRDALNQIILRDSQFVIRPKPRISNHARTCSRRVESRVSFHTSYGPAFAIAADRFETRQSNPMAVCS
jgi:hypothetical protein